MKKIFFALSIFILFFSQHGQSQSWEKAIGLRLGFPNSITYKQFITERAAVEGILGTKGELGYRSINLAAAYQIHNDILEDSFGELRWYFGAGATLVTYSYKDNFLGTKGGVSMGLQGYLGVDYTIKDVPINISLDWIPTFLFTGFGNGFGADNGAVAIRYIF